MAAPRIASTDARQRWATPRALVAELEHRWVSGGFTVDVAADPSNHVCRRWCGPGGDGDPAWLGPDGLAFDWLGERVFCNPPFEGIEPWVETACRFRASVAVLVLPVRASAGYWRALTMRASAIDWIRGRVNFLPPEGVKASSNAEATAAFIFRPPLEVGSRGGRFTILRGGAA